MEENEIIYKLFKEIVNFGDCPFCGKNVHKSYWRLNTTNNMIYTTSCFCFFIYDDIDDIKKFIKKTINKKTNKCDTVYFVTTEEGKNIKIGYSSNPDKRLKSLSTSSPYKIKKIKYIDGDMQTEKALHEKFKHLRKNGEWFEYNDEIKEFIRSL